jgi:hypothetical protein
MNTKMVEDFAQRYGAKVEFLRDEPVSYDYTGTAVRFYTKYYDTDRNNVEISLSMRSFEYMVEMDIQAGVDYEKQREEAHIRKQYPAVADAYHKYQMMLALCK